MTKLYHCALRGCPNTVETHGTYCDKHKDIGAQITNQQHKQMIDRLNALPQPWRQLYQTPEWKALQRRVIQDEPICHCCGQAPSSDAHHIVKHNGNLAIFFNRANLIGVCYECHKKLSMQQVRQGKTQREAGV